jgi:F420-non-reducing hydrogenase small subunit
VRDFGAKALSATASVIDCKEENALAPLIDALPDPVGTFYRYSLPSSSLGRRRME